MSSTTHEILITIRFSSTKHPALIHMDMIYTWHSPSPSKLYIYHFRLRLRRVISWVTRPRGPAVARFYDTTIFTARVLQYFLRNYVRCLNIFFLSLVGWVWSHQRSVKARSRKSRDCNIEFISNKWTLLSSIEASTKINSIYLQPKQFYGKLLIGFVEMASPPFNWLEIKPTLLSDMIFGGNTTHIRMIFPWGLETMTRLIWLDKSNFLSTTDS